MSFVGLDVGKKSIEAVRLQDKGSKPERRSFGTDSPSIRQLTNWLRPDDCIGLETGTLAKFLITCVKKKVEKVWLLDSTRLKLISESRKKTDKEDALKIAKIIAAFPESDLPLVYIPTDIESDDRALISEHEVRVKDHTRQINQLHSIFTHAGITELSRYDLATASGRDEQIKRLSGAKAASAERICVLLVIYEAQIAEIESCMKGRLKDEENFTRTVMSIPGIGVKAAFTYLGQVGLAPRFPNSSAVASYVGFTPSLMESGSSSYQGRCKRGKSALKRIFYQAAVTHVRTVPEGPLAETYRRVKAKRGGQRAMVGVARKLLELVFTLNSSRQLFHGHSVEKTAKKLKKIGLI